MSIRKLVPLSEADWRVEPAPAWVETREPDWDLDAPEEYGVALLLVDEQHHLPTLAASMRTVRRVLTRAAVQALGQVGIDFDPAAERLRIHDLVIWRRDAQGTWHGRSVADTQQFLVRQREQQLEQQMLNGRASVMALLEDVRVGDVIDLSWTIEPRDPLPGLRFTAFHGFAWTIPAGLTCFTLHLNPGTPLFCRLHAPEGAELPVHESAPERLHWRQSRPALTKFEPNPPPGQWNFPLLEVSAWPDWATVAGFADALWAEAMGDAPEQIAEAAARLRVAGDLPGSVAEAIRFVQGEVRYLNVDFGHGSGLLPNGAGTVLRRRFGDCKDKTVLLTALLRALGCEAWPLLVNPGWSTAMMTLHPSLGVFSHVIVTFLVDGKRYFVDPTFLGQRGDLAHLLPPPYRCGLEIRTGVAGLTPIPPLPAAELTVTETFCLDRKQRNGTVEQVLHATGWLADEVRGAIARSGEAAFFKARVEALQNHFPALEPDEASGEVRENAGVDSIEVRDQHRLPTWGPKGEKPPGVFRYGAHGLFLAVEKVEPPDQRTLPWALRHPMRVTHRVVVRGRCVRNSKPEKHRHSGPGFRYACDVIPGRRQVAFDYVWETTAPEVTAEQWPDYCRERTKALEHAGANVVTQSYWNGSRKGGWVYVCVVTLSVVVGIVRGMMEGEGPHRPSGDRRTVESEMQVAFEAAARGDFAAAEPVFERNRSQFARNPAFHFMRAEIALRQNRPERARQALEDGRRLEPQNPVSRLLEAQLCRAGGDVKQAKSILAEMAIEYRSDVRIFRELAITCGAVGDRAGARAAWGHVLTLAPGDTAALINYATLLWQAGERERADAMIQGAMAAQPEPTAALMATTGEYFAQTGRLEPALERMELAAKLAPDRPVWPAAALEWNLRAGKLDRAEQIAADLTRRFPKNPETWHAVALVALAVGDAERAEAAFRDWVRLAPRDPQAHAAYGRFLFETGRKQEAREVLARAAAEFPGDGMVWLHLRAVLESLGEPTAAAEAKQRAEALLTAEQRRALGP